MGDISANLPVDSFQSGSGWWHTRSKSVTIQMLFAMFPQLQTTRKLYIFPRLAPHPCICSKQDNLVLSLHDRRLIWFPRRRESTSLPHTFSPLSFSARSRLLRHHTRKYKHTLALRHTNSKVMNMYTPYSMAPTPPHPPHTLTPPSPLNMLISQKIYICCGFYTSQ